MRLNECRISQLLAGILKDHNPTKAVGATPGISALVSRGGVIIGEIEQNRVVNMYIGRVLLVGSTVYECSR